ncbi:MAG: ATP-grasp domain-containing protein [Gordonia sp. (in: high G+C Gram-positive bacteria)]
MIVDAWSGGKYLLPAFQSIGYPVLHVQSGDVPDVFRHDRANAVNRAEWFIEAGDDFSELIDHISRFEVAAVLAGSEGGVFLADRIANSLGVGFANDFATASARRNKFDMQERLREVGIGCISQELISDEYALAAWLDSVTSFPVVLKPVESAGTQGVHVCHTREQCCDAFTSILSIPDFFGSTNTAVLCQEFLDGDEYVINGVAADGRYVVTEGWKSDKTDNHGSRVYDTQYLFWHGDPHFQDIVAYVEDVCRALGLVNGPFHAEVMLTDRGPILIEIGARIAGGADPYVIEECLGRSQIAALVDAVARPSVFESRRGLPPVSAHRRAAYVYFVGRTHGRVQPNRFIDQVASVPGVVHVSYRYDIGDEQPLTRDLVTSPGVALVIAADEAALASAVNRIRSVESDFQRDCIR